MGFLSKSRIKAAEIVQEVAEFLQKKYEQHVATFSPASPFGMLLMVIANIAELIFTYLSHAQEEANIATAQNVTSIYGLARLTGHDAYRGGSARGIFQLKLNTSTADVITNGATYVKIKNGTRFQITQNQTSEYFVNIDTEYLILHVSDTDYINVPFIQGTIESQTFTSDGSSLQSFNPVVNNMTDHDFVKVYVNGKEWTKKDSLYDMNADEESFMCKSSVNVGLTVFFGNGYFGKIPENGAEIVISYILTDGPIGNINSSNLSYKFVGTGVDEFGGEVDLNEVLQINTVRPPSMGSNYEDPEFTRLIAPKASKSFVLATPDNYVSYLSKYNQFSFIYAYNTKDDTYAEDDNITYITMIPDVKKKFSSSVDYFSLPENEYKLSDDEKTNVMNALYDSGRMLVNSEVVINDVDIKHFVINIIIKYFEGYNKVNIRTRIREILNTYFININRRDIIPVSDLVALIERVDGVDTCSVYLVNQENEEAIVNGYYIEKYKKWNPTTLEYEIAYRKKYVDNTSDEDPLIGMDKFGNILIDKTTIMIPRGGWYDRNGVYYEETPEVGKLGPLNIFFTDETEANSYNKNQQKVLNNIMKQYAN